MTVRALVVGSLIADYTFRIPHRPAPGEVVVATSHTRFLGGKGFNQAVAVARLGAEVTVIGAVGTDLHGNAFLSHMVREDLDASRVVQLEGCPTGVAVPLVTPDGSVAYVQYPGANRMLSAQHCADLPESDVLLVQGEIPSRTSERAATVIRRRGGVVVVHPEPAEEMTRPLLDLATVVVADERHALRLRRHLGGEEGAHDIEALAAALCERDIPVVVGDDHGRLAWCDSDDAGVAEPPTVTVVDVTAGTDAGCAAVGIALAEGASLAEACAFAAAAWAATTSREGAEPALPTRQEVADLRAS